MANFKDERLTRVLETYNFDEVEWDEDGLGFTGINRWDGRYPTEITRWEITAYGRLSFEVRTQEA